MPVATRNVDLASRLRIPDAPPRLAEPVHREDARTSTSRRVVGILVARDGLTRCSGFIGIGVTSAWRLYVLALVPYVRGKRLPPNADKVLGHGRRWLREYRPETVLYFSGSKDSAYQVNMWLRPWSSWTPSR